MDHHKSQRAPEAEDDYLLPTLVQRPCPDFDAWDFNVFEPEDQHFERDHFFSNDLALGRFPDI